VSPITRGSCGGALLGALLAAPAALDAQVVAGTVVEQVSLAPVRGALVTIFEVDTLGELEPVAITTADGEGVFALDLPRPGSFRAQADADGLTSPLSPLLRFEVGDTVADLALLVPSRLLTMALECAAEASEGMAALVGVVRDPATDVVLPNAQVTATWQEGGVTRWADAVSDASGRYRICGVDPKAGTVSIRGALLGQHGPWEEVGVSGPAAIFHDVPVAIRTRPVTSGAQDVIQERILMEAAARSLGDLRGQLHDQLSEAPLPYAVVRIQGTSLQALADLDGRFLFEGIQPGSHVLEIRNLGSTVFSGPVEVPAGQDVFVGLRVAPRAVELEGVEVTVRSAVEELTRLTPFRTDIVYGEAMADEETRGARAFEVLRRVSPGLRVREVYPQQGLPWVCVESNRRVMRITDVPACEQVQVFVDGVRDPDGALLLRNLPASEIESIEFLPAIQAQMKFGVGGNTANGAVVIYTRGRGPYVSPLRNKR
jgi:hypothetical protein